MTKSRFSMRPAVSIKSSQSSIQSKMSSCASPFSFCRLISWTPLISASFASSRGAMLRFASSRNVLLPAQANPTLMPDTALRHVRHRLRIPSGTTRYGTSCGMDSLFVCEKYGRLIMGQCKSKVISNSGAAWHITLSTPGIELITRCNAGSQNTVTVTAPRFFSIGK